MGEAVCVKCGCSDDAVCCFVCEIEGEASEVCYCCQRGGCNDGRTPVGAVPVDVTPEDAAPHRRPS
jgi:hypothetical protein